MNQPLTGFESAHGEKFAVAAKKVKKISFGLILGSLLLTGCSSSPPQDAENACNIFEERRDWWRAANDMQDEWGTPIHVAMAIMYQESSFRARAVPPRRYLLGFIPWGRESDAFGYAQARTMTWDDYVDDAGRRRARRDNFADAIDFIGWFTDKTHSINGVSKWDAYAQYLNYHEGWGGYQRQTYLQKDWLVPVARRVESRADRYASQLRECEDDLNRNWFMRLLFG